MEERIESFVEFDSLLTCIIPITAANLSFFTASVSFSAFSSSNLKQILKQSESESRKQVVCYAKIRSGRAVESQS